jgi:VIT1/CCC1 family predicted Fe2+/Mn2+ transporter
MLHRHRDPSAGWLRPAVFGMMDGLVSNFGLIAGVTGGQLSAKYIAVTGWAGLVAGALSMAAGEFISVQSQNELAQHEVDVERQELAKNADQELDELTAVYIGRGVDPDTAALVATQISQDPEQALLVHSLVELGVNPGEMPSPYVASASSVASFAVGAFLPLLPYLFGATVLWPAAVIAALALFVAGSFVSRFTTRTWWYSGTRQLLFGLVTAGVAYAIGTVFHVAG